MNGYLEALDSTQLPRLIAGAINRITDLKMNGRLCFESIVFRGVSGALVAPPVAAHFGVPLAVVRKSGDDAHGDAVQGFVKSKYLIIDDFISSGYTIKQIVNAVRSHKNVQTPPVGVITYLRDFDRQLLIDTGATIEVWGCRGCVKGTAP